MRIAECKRLVAELWGGGARRPAFMRIPAAGGHRECKRRKLLAAAAPAANARGPGAAAAGAESRAAAGASPMPIIRAIALPHFHDEAALRLHPTAVPGFWQAVSSTVVHGFASKSSPKS